MFELRVISHDKKEVLFGDKWYTVSKIVQVPSVKGYHYHIHPEDIQVIDPQPYKNPTNLLEAILGLGGEDFPVPPPLPESIEVKINEYNNNETHVKTFAGFCPECRTLFMSAEIEVDKIKYEEEIEDDDF